VRDERLSRFALTSRDVETRAAQHHLKPVRLMPRRHAATGRLEVSVCRSGQLSPDAVWAICAKHLDPHVPKPAVGRGVGPGGAVADAGLGLDCNGVPYAEHADVVGWHEVPGVPDDQLKSFWKATAQQIAPAFSYVPRPD
jgi:hypothetical protein